MERTCFSRLGVPCSGGHTIFTCLHGVQSMIGYELGTTETEAAPVSSIIFPDRSCRVDWCSCGSQSVATRPPAWPDKDTCDCETSANVLTLDTWHCASLEPWDLNPALENKPAKEVGAAASLYHIQQSVWPSLTSGLNFEYDRQKHTPRIFLPGPMKILRISIFIYDIINTLYGTNSLGQVLVLVLKDRRGLWILTPLSGKPQSAITWTQVVPWHRSRFYLSYMPVY